MRGGGASTSGGRPTHFLAVRVDGAPRVHAAYETVHGALLRAEPGLRGALVEAASAHVTAGVLRLREGSAAGAAGPGPPLSGPGGTLAGNGVTSPRRAPRTALV